MFDLYWPQIIHNINYNIMPQHFKSTASYNTHIPIWYIRQYIIRGRTQFLEAPEEEPSAPSGKLTPTPPTENGSHRPKKITTKSPSRTLAAGGGGSVGGVLVTGKSKSAVPRKGSWHSHISPYSRGEEVANGGKRRLTETNGD